uniref:Uncharacterized protein n=1 Tax=Amphiprion ocellaris TaxID=80972 RepID=A0A3Q1BN97_AMPOC
MSSMLSPPSRRFSMSTSRLTPSTTICTSSTSEKPRRSALEMSKTPPTAAVSTPPERRTGEQDENMICTTDRSRGARETRHAGS